MFGPSDGGVVRVFMRFEKQPQCPNTQRTCITGRQISRCPPVPPFPRFAERNAWRPSQPDSPWRPIWGQGNLSAKRIIAERGSTLVKG